MRKLKLGYVGCGFMAQKVHIPNFMSINECELVALAEVRPRLGEKVARHYGINKLYTNHVELVNAPAVEAIAVSADGATQAEIAKDALRAGKCVFLEKPMGVSVKQAESLIEAAHAGGSRAMVAHMKRYDAGNELVKETIDEWRQSGVAGRLFYARAQDYGGEWLANLDTHVETTDEPYPTFPGPVPYPSWLPKSLQSNYYNYIQECCHLINLLRWFLDAGSNVKVKAVDFDSDGYTGIAIMEMNGVRAVLESGDIVSHRWEEKTSIYFTKGYIKTWPTILLLRNVPAEIEIYLGGDKPEFRRPLPQPTWTWAYKRQCEFFVHATLNNEPYRTDAEDTINDLHLLEEIYRKYVEGR